MIISFRAFIKESNNMDISHYEKILSSMGYVFEKKGSKRLIIKTDKDRISVLKDLAAKISGAQYKNTLASSSVGGTVTKEGITILAKPLKSSGSGAGAAMTSLVESAQCLYCAAAWYGNKDYSPETLKKVSRYSLTTDSVEKIIKDLPSDWQDSSITVANTLYKNFAPKKYTFHKGSSWVDRLEKKFNSLNRIEKEFSNLNKWSPADIYCISQTALNENFSSANSILELNALLLKYVRSKDIIPVSLKKTMPGKASLKQINYSNDRSTYEIGNPIYTVGKRGFFDSKDVYMNFLEGEIQFRGFNTVDFQGEIKGKYASHGKVGGGIIRNIVKRNTGKLINMPREVADKYNRDITSLYGEFYTYYSKVLGSSAISYEKFVVECSKKDLGWHVSKFIGTQMVYYIKSSPKAKLDAIIGSIIGYAASESEMSAPYIKVS
jgi:hypothetical protein